MFPSSILKSALLVFGLVTVASARAACDAPFCSVNADWGAQAAAHPGALDLGLSFGYANQDQLRHGRHPAPSGAELDTINRHWDASLTYDLNATWGFALNLPLLVDDHAHTDPVVPAVRDTWRFSGLGDASALVRHRLGAGENRSRGIEFGLKLPTGRYDETNSAGLAAERFVQPGTGTTDVVLGTYYALTNPDLGVTTFLHAQWQHPLAPRANYQPGSVTIVDAGIQRQTTDRLDSLVQFHAIVQGRDTGTAADYANSGYSALYLSPGIAYHPSPRYGVFAYFNQPLLRHYNGTQLTADWSILVGANYTFGHVAHTQ